MYGIMLFIGAILSGIALTPGLQDWLKGVPFCSNSSSVLSYGVPTVDCSYAVGYLVVYRICFALVCFFALMAVMMLGAKSSKDSRAPIQNGFWGIKFIVVAAVAAGAFFIPAGQFGTLWMWVGLVGGFIFIIMQLVLIVDFAHTWAELWIGEWFRSIYSGFGHCYRFDLQIITMKANHVNGTVHCSVPLSFNMFWQSSEWFCFSFTTIVQ